MGKIKLFPSPTYEVKQPKDPIIPRLPMTGMLVGPSKSGKSTALVSSRGEAENQYALSDGNVA